MAEDRGRYVTVADEQVLVFVRELPHPITEVWQAVTDPDRVAAWMPSAINGDLTTVGAALEFVFPDDAGVDGPSTGEVLVSEEPRHLAFRWEDEEIRIQLEPTDDDGTRLEFTDVIPDESVPVAARTAAGWHVCLDELEEHLTTGKSTPPSSGPTPRFRELYDGYLADGVPGGAPIPGE
jgi:uncharacterized protein YndB with AHSA1/START domain